MNSPYLKTYVRESFYSVVSNPIRVSYILPHTFVVASISASVVVDVDVVVVVVVGISGQSKWSQRFAPLFTGI